MTHYDDVLSVLRQKGELLAGRYIGELYDILHDEEKLRPEDCRSKIEHDCIDLWSKATIRKSLPEEAKDATKQKAAKIGNEMKKQRKKAILLATNDAGGVGINLTENGSVSQSEAESQDLHNKSSQQPSDRVSTQSMYDTTKIIADKDRRIEELESDLEEAVKQGGGCMNISANIFLSSKFASEIYHAVSVNRSAGNISEFNLKHDGNEVIAVQEISKDSES
jgi:hypothetical protein